MYPILYYILMTDSGYVLYSIPILCLCFIDMYCVCASLIWCTLRFRPWNLDGIIPTHFICAFRVGDWFGFLHNTYVLCPCLSWTHFLVYFFSGLIVCHKWCGCILLPLSFLRYMFFNISVFVFFVKLSLCVLLAGNLYYFIIQAFLVDFLDCMFSSRFGNFFFNRYFCYVH